MLAAWNQPGSAEARARTVTDLVDVYVAHPQNSSWWRQVLLASALGRKQPDLGGGPRR
jgi:hypothetical protein